MTVILSATAAADQLLALYGYLESECSPEARRHFQQKLNRSIKAIKLMPFAFPKSNSFPDCRKCVVSPRTSVIYRAQKEVIEVVPVLDNRQSR